MRLSKKQIQVDILFKPNAQGISEWIKREAIDKTCLNWGGNGNCRHGVYFGDNRFIWEKQSGKNGKITHLRTAGFSEDELHGAARPVRGDIKTHFSKLKCLHCGSRTGIIADHKNGLYNDPRVLNPLTQRIDDFQPLCNGCNTIKREWERKTRVQKKRQPPPPCIRVMCGNNFYIGNTTLNENDTDWYKGTYWGDINAFCAFFGRISELFEEEFIENDETIINLQEKLEKEKEKVKTLEANTVELKKKMDRKWRLFRKFVSEFIQEP